MGADNIPTDWLDHLAEWPRNIVWMRRLAQQLTDVIRDNQPQQPMPMHWAKTFVRNLLFGATVIVLALRRLLPPY